MDYKNTLLMPKTEFPMKGNLAVKEPESRKKWMETRIYENLRANAIDLPTFVLHDGPPYANGNLHIGHAMNKILKDFIVRSKFMSGYNVSYIPGWDTHGLPIEQALTKSGVDRKEISIVEFRKLCEEYAKVQINNQKEQFLELNVIGDYENYYATFQKEIEEAQIKVFSKMVERGLIYRGEKPVFWSPTSESALAEAEIEYKDKQSHSIFVGFDVLDSKGLFDKAKLVIWTTTPWTIPANRAVSINEKYNYALVNSGNENYLVATDLKDSLEKILKKEFKILKEFKGLDLEHVTYRHPVFDMVCPVILGDHVSLDAGSGLVHTSPGHGEDDYQVGKKYGLEIISALDSKGHYVAEMEFLAGLYYEKANKVVIELLEERNTLLAHEIITHSYPHDWRTKKPVVFRATPQWFASVEKIRPRLLEVIKNEVDWKPEWGMQRLYNMIESRGDWCISRQRAWGVPIPVFYNEDDSEILDTEVIDNIAKLFGLHGSNIWFSWDTIDLLPAGYTNIKSPNNNFRKETDIMDVWFDSGTTHAGVLNARGIGKQADVYLEGSDQYRGWFNSSLITSVAMNNYAPYKQVISHGFVNDKKGNKMSKSLGNIIAPKDVIKQFGSDVLRLWVASVDYTQDVKISDESLKQTSEGYRKIRNTAKFLLGNLNDFNASNIVSVFHPFDEYILAKLSILTLEIKENYAKYNFQNIYKKALYFITQDLSHFYLDYAKDFLYCESENSLRRRQIQTTLHYILLDLVKALTPILPHTTDEIYQLINIEKFPNANFEKFDFFEFSKTATFVEIEKLFVVRELVLKEIEIKRAAKEIGTSLDAKVNIISEEYFELLHKYEQELPKFMIVSEVELSQGDLKITIEISKKETCPRCWNKLDLVNGLCERCAKVIVEINA